MITDTFDTTTEAIISPEKVYGTTNMLCDICIITFSNHIVEEILNSGIPYVTGKTWTTDAIYRETRVRFQEP